MKDKGLQMELAKGGIGFACTLTTLVVGKLIGWAMDEAHEARKKKRTEEGEISEKNIEIDSDETNEK